MMASLSHLTRPSRVIAVALGLLCLSVAVIPTRPATAEEPITNLFVSVFPVSGASRQYELVHLIYDFPPGAATPEHVHGGDAYVTVLEGEITLTRDGASSVYGVGETFVEPALKYHSASNEASTPAQIMASLLLPVGAPGPVNHPSRPVPPVLPEVSFLGRQTFGTQPSQFSLLQAIVDFAPGAVLSDHFHGGPGLATVIAGSLTIGTEEGEVVGTPGATFVENVVHDAHNSSSDTATVLATFLLPPGAELTTFVPEGSTTTSSGVASIQPPNTGEAGLAAGR